MSLRSSAVLTSLLTLALAAGCGDEKTGTPLADSGEPAADTGVLPDGGPGDAEVNDAGALDTGAPDAGSEDSGIVWRDAQPRDTGAPDGSGQTGDGSTGQACADLLACCANVSANFHDTCVNLAMGGDEAACQRVLDLAGATCTGGPTDAGPAVDSGPFDAGPIGPVCSEYLACCPELGILQQRCQQTASTGDEAACQRALDLAHRVGVCLSSGDAGVTPDASAPGDATPFDALPIPDVGIPDVEIPDVSIPDVEIPDVGPLPDLGLPFPDAEPADATPDADVDAGSAPDA